MSAHPQSALGQPIDASLKIMHAVDAEATYTQFHREKITSPVAYHTPPTPAYLDRPFSDTLMTSLDAADYIFALRKSGQIPLLSGSRKLTLLVPTNATLEADPRFQDQSIFLPENKARLHEALGGTILMGRWDGRSVAHALKRRHASSMAILTIDHRVVNVSLDKATGQPVFTGKGGVLSQLVDTGTSQTNGVFFFTRNVIDPQIPKR